MAMKETILKLKTILPAKDFIVTGSFVLAEYGLMDASRVSDIDIILVKPELSTLDTINRLMVDFPAKTKVDPIDIPDPECSVKKVAVKPHSCSAIFMFDNIKVDIFVLDSDSRRTLTVDGLKYSVISDIIKSKVSYGRMKDWLQLRDMARLFFKEEEFTVLLNTSWRSALKITY
jgi:hypothetical protein